MTTSEITGKSLAYIEFDVDVYRITRFEAVHDGEAVAGWTKMWGTDTTLTGAAVASFPSGRGARVLVGSDSQVLWAWDAMPHVADVSLVALLRSNVPLDFMGLVARASGAASSETAYFAQLRADALYLYRVVGGSFTALANVAVDVAEDEDVYLRFDVATVDGPGALVRAKLWRGALSDEPEDFTISATDTSAPITAAGAVGLYAFEADGDHVCGHFRARSLLGSLTETIRHVKPTNYLPTDIDAVPDLLEAQLSPGMISLGENLGERATLTVGFQDHLGADLGELWGRGTHWGKVRAREILRRGDATRVKRGLLGTAFGDFEARNYVFDSLSGPSPQGAVTITAKDPLKLADNDRALAPRPNNGFLVAAIDDNDTAAVLSPAGIGNAQYATSGYVVLGGKEICAFTRSADALTLTRAQFNTEAIAHSAEDRVQQCLNVVGQDPANIIAMLLQDYAGVDPSFIPLAAWQLETATYLQRVYTRLIAEPTGVNDLVSKLIEEAGLVVWFDDILNQIRLQVLRGIPVDAFVYSQANLMGPLQVADQPEKQITEVVTWYGVRNPLEPLDQTNNYRSGLSSVDLEEQTRSGVTGIRTIFGTWIPPLARTTAQRVNDLQLGRFVRAPRKFQFDVMRYSGVEEPQPGGGARVTWWGSQDEAGDVINVPIQFTRITPMADRIRAEAEEMRFIQFDDSDLINRQILIDGNFSNLNVFMTHNSNYPAVTAQGIINGVNLTVVVGAGVIVGSASTGVAAMIIDDVWPTAAIVGDITNTSPIIQNIDVDVSNLKVGTRVSGSGIPVGARVLTVDSASQITLNMNATATAADVALTLKFFIAVIDLGRIQGAGGAGGRGVGAGDSTAGSAGGLALYVRHPIDLTDASGDIWGGGGGGGGGGTGSPIRGGGGGGGGAGLIGGAGGVALGGGCTPGSPGTTEAGGVGGTGVFANLGGGNGGGPGLPGIAGNLGTNKAGGAAGKAIDGVSFVTTVGSPGDRRGAQIN